MAHWVSRVPDAIFGGFGSESSARLSAATLVDAGIRVRCEEMPMLGWCVVVPSADGEEAARLMSIR